MRISFVVLASLLSLFCVADVTAQGIGSSRIPETRITCVISLESVAWLRTDPALVRLSLQNTSQEDVDIVDAAMVLTRTPQQSAPPDSFWAPIDLRHIPKRLRIAKGQTIDLALDANSLRWQRQISSTWPNRQLFEIAPQGEYSLHIEMATMTSEIKSNQTLVTIRKGGLRKVPGILR